MVERLETSISEVLEVINARVDGDLYQGGNNSNNEK